MFNIKTKRDLKFAYGFLSILEKEASNQKENEKLQKSIVDLKKEIRAAVNKAADDRRIVKEYGIDGYIELIALPERLTDLENAIEYFEDVEKIYYRPTYYDCTGQAFTSWYKVFKRNDRFYAYHSVCFDVWKEKEKKRNEYWKLY